MRIGVLAILFCWLLAGTCPASARTPDAQSSRVENHTQQTWKVSVGSWAAGMIRIREAGSRIELASLKGEGEGYLLEAGKAVEMEILPTKKCLHLRQPGQPRGPAHPQHQRLPGGARGQGLLRQAPGRHLRPDQLIREAVPSPQKAWA
jgi:hypothetical protein